MSYFSKFLCLYITTSSFVYAMEGVIEEPSRRRPSQFRNAPITIVPDNFLETGNTERQESPSVPLPTIILPNDDAYRTSLSNRPYSSPSYSTRPPYLSTGARGVLSISVSNNISHSTLIFNGGYLTAPGALPSSPSPSSSLSLLNKHISAPKWRADEISHIREIENPSNNEDEPSYEHFVIGENIGENTAFHQKALKLIVKINNNKNMLFHEETPQFLLMGKLRKFSPETLDQLLLQPNLLEFLRLSSQKTKLKMLSALAKFPGTELYSLFLPLNFIFERVFPIITKQYNLSALSLFFKCLLKARTCERLNILEAIVTLLNNDKPLQAGDFIDANTLLAIFDILEGLPEEKRAASVSGASSFIQNISDSSLIPTILLDLSKIDHRHYHLISQLLKPWPKFFYNPMEERRKFLQMITELADKGDRELINILSELFKDEFNNPLRQDYLHGIELANICEVTKMLIPVASEDRQLLLKYASDFIDSKAMSASTATKMFVSILIHLPANKINETLNTFKIFFERIISYGDNKKLYVYFLERIISCDQLQQEKLISYIENSTPDNSRQFFCLMGEDHLLTASRTKFVNLLTKLSEAEWPPLINCLEQILKNSNHSQKQIRDLIDKIDSLSINQRLLLTSYPHLVRPLLTTLDRSLTTLEAVAPEDREDVLQAVFALWKKKPELDNICDRLLEGLSKLTSQERSIFLNHPKLNDWLRHAHTLKMLNILSDKTQFGFMAISDLIEDLVRLEQENVDLFRVGLAHPALLMAHHFMVPESPWYQHVFNYWRPLLASSDETVARKISRLIIQNHQLYNFPEEHELVQEAARINVLLENRSGPLNPFKIYTDLKAKREEVIDLSTLKMITERAQGYKVQLNPEFLNDLGHNLAETRVPVAVLPAYSPTFFEDLVKKFEKRIEAQPMLEDKIEQMFKQDLEVERETRPFAILKAGALGSGCLPSLLRQRDSQGQTVSILSAKLIALITKVQAASTERGEEDFSEQERKFLELIFTINACPTGKKEAIHLLYSQLDRQDQFINARWSSDTSEALIQAINHTVRRHVDKMFSNNDRFMRALLRMKADEVIEQLPHQRSYIRNLIGPATGLVGPLEFDNHTQQLYQRLIDLPKAEVLQIFYQHFLPTSLIDAIHQMFTEMVQQDKPPFTWAELQAVVYEEDQSPLWAEINDNVYAPTEVGTIAILNKLGVIKAIQ